MKRAKWLVMIAVVLASVLGFAALEGRGSGFRTVGGFGGEGELVEIQRSAEVELEGGRRVSGDIMLKSLTVETDVGRYSIAPDKIKMIRFLKPPVEAGAVKEEEDFIMLKNAMAKGVMAKGAMRRVNRNMTAFVNDPVNNGTPSSLTRGKVITTTGKEILGDIYIPVEFKIALDVGSLYLAAGKLRAITFTEAKDEAGRKDEAARPAAAAPDAPAQTGQPGAAVAEESPIFFRQGNRLVVFMPGGNRVAFYDIESKTSKTIELSTSKDSRVEVSPVVGPDILALSLHGPKITRIAVADLARGTWHPQDLRQPAEGRVSPIVGQGLAIYNLGRFVYAYSVPAQRWDVVEIPEGPHTTPTVGSDGATIQGRGHIYLFSLKTGKWEHIDVRAILDIAGAEKKK